MTASRASHPTDHPTGGAPRSVRALVTAGPTEEPLDEVRFLGNRSSGRMGLTIAEALLAAGVDVTLALGPVRTEPSSAMLVHPRLRVVRFRSSRDLEAVMRNELGSADLVVMAAAVADYRPKAVAEGKMRRTDTGLVLDLEGVPDLLASTKSVRKPGSRVVGFALEPRERLERSALDKLERKDLFGIVANPLETMDAPDIEGTLFLRDGSAHEPDARDAGGRMAKQAFAAWLVRQLLAPQPA